MFVFFTTKRPVLESPFLVKLQAWGPVKNSRFYRTPLVAASVLYKNVSAFFFQTSISKTMSDLKGRGCILTLQQYNCVYLFIYFLFFCDKIRILRLKKLETRFYRTECKDSKGSKSTFVEEGRRGGGEGYLKREQKRTGGRGPSIVYVRFFSKKC